MKLIRALIRTVGLSVSALACLVTDASSQPKDIPFPQDVVIVSPSAEAPKELAAFSGKWFGHLNGIKTGTHMSDALIVVENISTTDAVQVFYSGIGRSRTNYGRSYWYRVTGAFIDGGLEFKIGNSTAIQCRINDDGTMSVTAGQNRGSFKRLTQ